MSYLLIEINRRAASDPAAFLAESDASYQRHVCQAAERILQNRARSPIVLLSGPSGSGKTTTALKIEEELRRRGVGTHAIALDNYFQTPDRVNGPKTPDGDYDYESPRCLDMALLHEHFSALERGEEIAIPQFDFAHQRRMEGAVTPLRLGQDEIAIFEGIHALNDDLAGQHPEAFKVYISARSNILRLGKVVFKGTWMRLTRRAVRDLLFRGTDVAGTLAMWDNVRRGEKMYISPFKNRADLIFDSSLPYEVNVLRQYAEPLFQQIPAENVRRREILEMIWAFDRFVPIDSELVAKDSLIREFIGGGSYGRH
ncbi:MAG TPA: nucleoside kinase [Candidatus Onthomonas avicola]|nr:nucleoside kinase [Candidatus Onthomonas avicola]